MTPEQHIAELAKTAQFCRERADAYGALRRSTATAIALDRAADALTAARERIAALEAALEPFAREAGDWECDDAPDECPVLTGGPADERVSVSEFTIGDLRRARAALTNKRDAAQ